jgi:hypothetical protein
MSDSNRFCAGQYVPRQANLRPECKSCALSQTRYRPEPAVVVGQWLNGQCLTRVEVQE